MSLYEILEVEITATKIEIKKAYKSKANKMHPDKEGGNEEDFKQLKHAYEVLFDEERRKHYDETGQDGNVPNAKNDAINQLSAIFNHMIDNEKVGNIIDLSKDYIESLMEKANSQNEIEEKRIEKLEKKIDRIKSKKTINIFKNIILQKIHICKTKIAQTDHFLKIGNIMLKMLDDYEDTRPEKEEKQVHFTNFENSFFIMK